MQCAVSAHEGKCVCDYRGVCIVSVCSGHRTGWLQPVRRLKPVILPRSVRESTEQRAQVDPRVDVQVRRQAASDADGRGVVSGARQLGDSGGLSQ